jgi:hypothetical protein
MMTGARGEATILVPDSDGDREVQVLFTNRAIAEAEEVLGKGIQAIAEGFNDGRSGIRDMAHLLRAGMEAARREARAGNRRVSMKDAFDVLDAVGFAGVAEPVLLAVADVVGYGTGLEDELDGDGLPNA